MKGESIKSALIALSHKVVGCFLTVNDDQNFKSLKIYFRNLI